MAAKFMYDGDLIVDRLHHTACCNSISGFFAQVFLGLATFALHKVGVHPDLEILGWSLMGVNVGWCLALWGALLVARNVRNKILLTD